MQVSVLNTGVGTLEEQIEDFKDLLGLASQKPQTTRGSCAQLTAERLRVFVLLSLEGKVT